MEKRKNTVREIMEMEKSALFKKMEDQYRVLKPFAMTSDLCWECERKAKVAYAFNRIGLDTRFLCVECSKSYYFWFLVGVKIEVGKDGLTEWIKFRKESYQVANGVWCDKWDVVGSNGDPYVVANKVDGSFGCSCPGWKFKKAPKPDCKHIRAIKQSLGMEERVSPLLSGRTIQTEIYTETVPVKVQVEQEFFNVRRKFRD